MVRALPPGGATLLVALIHGRPLGAAVAAAVAADPAVKGMWVVPTYANPTGAVCTQEVAAALAAMPTAAPDFTIFWDNAYAVHHLGTEEAKSADLLSLCAASGNPDRAFLFASTSKVTFAGAGVAFVGVADDVFAVGTGLRHGLPLDAGRESGATAAAQA